MGSMNANLFLVQIHFIQTFYEDIFFLGYSRIKKKKIIAKISNESIKSLVPRNHRILLSRMKNIFIRSIKILTSSYHRLSCGMQNIRIFIRFMYIYIFFVKMIGSFNGLAQGNNIA